MIRSYPELPNISDDESDRKYLEISSSTIRVKMSDDDYIDITLDWKNRRAGLFQWLISFFEQLSSFTGIPVTDVSHLDLNVAGTEHSHYKIYMENPLNPFIGTRDWEWDLDGYMKSFENYPNYRLKTYLIIKTGRYPTYVRYVLTCTDLVNETECNRFFCHSMATRAYTNRIVKMFDSGIISSLEEKMQKNYDVNSARRILKPRLVPGYEYARASNERDGATNEWLTALHDLDIGSTVHTYCDEKYLSRYMHVYIRPDEDNPYPEEIIRELYFNREPRYYSPNRG